MNRLVLLLMLGWTGAFLDAGLVDEQTGLALDAGLNRCVAGRDVLVAGLHEQVVVEQFAFCWTWVMNRLVLLLTLGWLMNRLVLLLMLGWTGALLLMLGWLMNGLVLLLMLGWTGASLGSMNRLWSCS